MIPKYLQLSSSHDYRRTAFSFGQRLSAEPPVPQNITMHRSVSSVNSLQQWWLGLFLV